VKKLFSPFCTRARPGPPETGDYPVIFSTSSREVISSMASSISSSFPGLWIDRIVFSSGAGSFPNFLPSCFRIASCLPSALPTFHEHSPGTCQSPYNTPKTQGKACVFSRAQLLCRCSGRVYPCADDFDESLGISWTLYSGNYRYYGIIIVIEADSARRWVYE